MSLSAVHEYICGIIVLILGVSIYRHEGSVLTTQAEEDSLFRQMSLYGVVTLDQSTLPNTSCNLNELRCKSRHNPGSMLMSQVQLRSCAVCGVEVDSRCSSYVSVSNIAAPKSCFWDFLQLEGHTANINASH